MKYKRILLSVISVFLCALLCSCADFLGIDDTDYAAESVVSELEIDSEISLSLKRICDVLTFSRGGIVCFDKWQDVSDEYTDIVLDYLAGTYFEKYSANGEMFDLLAEKYPELTINTVVSAEDLSNTVYEFFGGDIHLKHKDTTHFTYLDKINAYILSGKLVFEYTTSEILYLDETENTYRATVRFSQNGKSFDDDYLIIFKKRDEDRAPYIYSVSVSNTVRW